jgi:hypothetical protein
VLKSLDLLFDQVLDRQLVIDFAKRQLRNRRNAVKLKARAFLKKHEVIAQPDGVANGSLPVRSKTNPTPSAAGSRRPPRR